MLLDAYGKPISKESIKLEPGHFATAIKVQDFRYLLSILPDPDPILRKMGKDITALRDILIDGRLSSNITVRFSAVASDQWNIVPQAEDALSKKAYDFIVENFSNLNIPFIINEMMEHILYGFKPEEILYASDGNYWYIQDIVGKPTEWFTWNKDNQMVLKKGFNDYEDLPPFKFITIQHRASYDNPFGEKLLSKCFWPATFKKNGWMWWTNFVEKFGSAFIYGTYPLSREEMKLKLLDALEAMVSDAVAAIPEGSKVEIHESGQKDKSSLVYKDYKAAADEEITITILGQSLTTSSGDKGSYALAKVHDLVREDLNFWDKSRIIQSFNTIIKYITFFNFGENAIPPKFAFIEEEKLKIEKADRDAKVFAFSAFKPTKKYLVKTYGYEEDDIEEVTQSQSDNFSIVKPRRRLFDKLKSIFADKPKITNEDKQELKNYKILNEYADQHSSDFQNAVDDIIDALFEEIQKASDYKEVFEIIIKKYPELNTDEVCRVMDNIQYMSRQVGAFEKSKKKSLIGY
jgi:phage gp29-like protein